MGIKPRSRMTKAIFALVALLVVINIVWRFGADPTIVPDPRGVGQEVTAERPAPEEGSEDVEPAEASDNAEPGDAARRIVHVPGGQENSVEPLPATSESWNPLNTPVEELVDTTALNLQRALDGNAYAAYFVHEARQMCHRVPRSQGMVTAMLRARASSYAQLKRQGTPQQENGVFGSGPGAIYPDDDQQRQHFDRWNAACDEFDSIFTNDLRDDLIGLAEDGHAVARYLYSVWRPTFSPTVKSFEDTQSWQLNALRFSYLSLEEGKPLGLLAFGQSYMAALFTPQNLALGLSLRKAAVDCGLEISMVQVQTQMLEPDTVIHGDLPYRASREEMLSMAEGFRAQYCQ